MSGEHFTQGFRLYFFYKCLRLCKIKYFLAIGHARVCLTMWDCVRGGLCLETTLHRGFVYVFCPCVFFSGASFLWVRFFPQLLGKSFIFRGSKSWSTTSTCFSTRSSTTYCLYTHVHRKSGGGGKIFQISKLSKTFSFLAKSYYEEGSIKSHAFWFSCNNLRKSVFDNWQ